MQTIEQSTRSFGFLQSPSVLTIHLQRDLANLLQQLLFALSQKQNLILSKVSQFASAFSTADTTLMATKPSEQRFQHQIVLVQPWNVVTMQQIRAVLFPRTVPGSMKGRLCRSPLEIRLK